MTQQTSAVQTQSNMFSILDGDIKKVFHAKPINGKDANGQPVEAGMSMTFRSRKEIASEFNLKGKDNKDALDTAILGQSDAAFRMAKGHIAGLNGEWTLAKLSTRTLASGVRQITLVTREVKRSTIVSEEKLAQWMFPDVQYPAMTLAEKLEGVREARARQEAQLAGNLLDAAAV